MDSWKSVILGIIVFAITGCAARTAPAERKVALSPATAPASPATPERTAAILEAALRIKLNDFRPHETVYVPLDVSGGLKDPPQDWLKRVSDLPYKIGPVSAARLPKRDEMKAPDRYRLVEDPDAGKDATIYSIEITKWISDTRVRVYVETYSGPLAAQGGSWILELHGDRWVRIATEGGWVS